jgi:23S rRNA pseudouridine1911/1915/1917 synthase
MVRVDGRLLAKGTRLGVGAIVEVAAHPAAGGPIAADPTVKIVVLYQDDQLVAVDKPAGVPSHPLRPGERGTVANGLVARFPSCAGASEDPREGGLAHRLDTATSGVLIAARSPDVWATLRRALGGEDCRKSYLCEVWGAPPDVGRIDAEIGRRGRRGGVVRVGGGGRQPRAAATEWTVIARRHQTVLLEARLHAGRPHQVRAHLAAAGFPIVGDDRYDDRYQQRYGDRPGGPLASRVPTRLHLHASALRFRHPVTGSLLEISAPAPPWAELGGLDSPDLG